MAYGAYRQYFPPVSESWRKGRAYPIRSWGSEPKIPHPEERQVSRDQGVEPLRTNTGRIDEEQPGPAFRSPRMPARQASYAEAEPNLFRQQISKSQRLRQSEFRHRRDASASSTERNAPNALPAFSPLNERRPRERRSDGNWSTSSSEHDFGEDGFEMQPRRRSTAPLPEADTHPAHRLGAKDFEQDTGYHPRIQSPTIGLQALQAPLKKGDTESTASLEHTVPPSKDGGAQLGVRLVET